MNEDRLDLSRKLAAQLRVESIQSVIKEVRFNK